MDGSAQGGVLAGAERDAMRGMLQEAAINAALGMEIDELGDGYAVLVMPVAEAAFNHVGRLHGGAVAALVDQAAGTAAARAGGLDPARQTLVTVDLHVRYLGRARGAFVRARAEVLKVGRQIITVECRVTDEHGALVAAGDFSMMIVPLGGNGAGPAAG